MLLLLLRKCITSSRHDVKGALSWQSYSRLLKPYVQFVLVLIYTGPMSPYSIEQYVLRLLSNDRDYGTINKYLDSYSDMPSPPAKSILIQYIP
jgi:hypothetical protein